VHFQGTTTATIKNSSIVDNNEYGLVMDGGVLFTTAGGPTFTGNVLSGNDRPIYLSAPAVAQLDASSTFTGNTTDRVQISGGTVVVNSFWQDLDADYEITGDVNVHHAVDPILTLEPGSTFQMGPNADLLIGNGGTGELGGLIAQGDDTDPLTIIPITFTSNRATKAPGDWGYLFFGNNCIDAQILLEDVVVEYGGGNGGGELYFYFCNGSATDSTIRDSSAYGVYRTGSTPTLTNNTYSNNASGNVF
jgi:hypothetical protein